MESSKFPAFYPILNFFHEVEKMRMIMKSRIAFDIDLMKRYFAISADVGAVSTYRQNQLVPCQSQTGRCGGRNSRWNTSFQIRRIRIFFLLLLVTLPIPIKSQEEPSNAPEIVDSSPPPTIPEISPAPTSPPSLPPAATSSPTTAQPTFPVPTVLPLKEDQELSSNVPTNTESLASDEPVASLAPSNRPTVSPSSPVPLLTSPPSATPVTAPTENPVASPSGNPSAAPTPLPAPITVTLEPSPQPSSTPTTAPIVPLSSMPSVSPSAKPSVSPSTTPSVSPSTRPTAVPSTQPSTIPSDEPSLYPSYGPSGTPSIQPTRPPTFILSEMPSTVPTDVPSRLPTTLPSLEPSSLPTQIPSLEPSESPTLIPSDMPSSQPSLLPSETPSDAPSFSSMPSFLPTTIPSSEPSVLPSSAPSQYPSFNPTGAPSSVPSSSPSLPTQRFDINLSIEMQLPGFMVGQVFDFEQALEEHIFSSIESTDFGNAPLLQLVVIADVNNQILVEVGNETDTNPATRRLQQTNPYKVFTVIRISFKSVETRDSAEIEQMIGDSLNNDVERQNFMNRLVEKDFDFFSLARLERVEVEGVQPEEEQLLDGSQETENENFLYIILGAAGGGFAALVALGILSMRRRTAEIHSTSSTPMDEELAQSSEPQSVQKFDVGEEVMVERQDDISTLGEPFFGGMGGMIANDAERDEQTASVGNDYDYTKQYLKAQGLSSLGESGEYSKQLLGSISGATPASSESFNNKFSGPVGAYVFSDDASFEDQELTTDALEQQRTEFEVHVPPGKLGMVIDTPDGSSPVVHAIKSDSVLATKIVVGDRLIAVDGDDVTGMTAVQVSKLISLKADQHRIMTFVRGGSPRKDFSSRSDIGILDREEDTR